MTRYILTDVDGCLLDWVPAFNQFMKEKGWDLLPEYYKHFEIKNWYHISEEKVMQLVNEFNSSAAIGFLDPYIDSKEYIEKLAQDGYRFIAVSAMGANVYAHKLREQNLINEFGPVFNEFHFTPILVSKKEILKKIKNNYINKGHTVEYWIEDKPSNAIDGHELGFNTYLINHVHNSDLDVVQGITRVNSWKEIYKEVTKNAY